MTTSALKPTTMSDALQAIERREDFAAILPKHAVGAEVGVFSGRFSRQLCRLTEPTRFYAIDAWWEGDGETFASRPKVRTRDAHGSTLIRLRPWISSGVAQVLVRKSQQALRELEPGHLDWLYLDAGHEFQQTLEELRLCSRVVKPSGIIAGHDFICMKWQGVFKAIKAFLTERPEYELFYLDNFSNWALRHSQ